MQKMLEDNWTMKEGTPWHCNNVRDYPGMIICVYDKILCLRILYFFNDLFLL